MTNSYSCADQSDGELHQHRLARHPWLSGGVLGAAALPAHALLSTSSSTVLAAVILALIAGVYVGYAFQDGRIRIVGYEIVVAAGFVAAALVGVLSSRWLIPGAYALHGVWDIASPRAHDANASLVHPILRDRRFGDGRGTCNHLDRQRRAVDR